MSCVPASRSAVHSASAGGHDARTPDLDSAWNVPHLVNHLVGEEKRILAAQQWVVVLDAILLHQHTLSACSRQMSFPGHLHLNFCRTSLDKLPQGL